MLAVSPAPWQVNPVPDPEAASPTGQTGGASRAVRGPQSLVRPQPTKQVTTFFYPPVAGLIQYLPQGTLTP